MNPENETAPARTGAQTTANCKKSNISRAEIQAAIDRGWWLIKLAGKIPTEKEWCTKRYTVDELVAHVESGGNLGLVCGAASGVVVVDFDHKPDKGYPIEAHQPMMDRLPKTVVVETGGGGRHFYFRMPATPIKNSTSKLAPCVDVKSDGGYVVFPGSRHPETGELYRWADGHTPDDVEIAELAELPQWIIEALAPKKPAPVMRDTAPPRPAMVDNGRLSKYLEAALAGEVAAVRSTPEGGRNARLNDAALKLAALGVDDSIIEAELTAAALDAGLDPREIAATIKSGAKAGKANPRELPEAPSRKPWIRATPAHEESEAETPEVAPTIHADLLLAKYLEKRWRRRIRFATHDSTWRWWNERTWAALTESETLARAADALRFEIAERMTQSTDPEHTKALATLAVNVCKVAKVRAALTFLGGFEGISTRPEQWDADTMLLNVGNGLLDLRTGRLGPPNPDKLCSKIAPIAFDVAATCPRWLRFLGEVFGGDEDLIRYLQWSCGLALTGDTAAQAFWIGHGTGANGKSTFLNVVSEILGTDYSHTLPAEELLLSRHEKHSTERAALMGKRLVVALESPDGARFNESLLKSLTGGERVRARFMHCDSFEYVPSFKIWLATNHRPRVRDDSPGFWRRVRLVPFNQSFEGARRDCGIMTALRAEYSGILNWMLAGIANGVTEPAIPTCVQAATNEYRGASNAVEQFFKDCVEITKSDYDQVTRKALFAAYEEWSGGRCESPRNFAERVRKSGIDEARAGKNRERVWIGIRLEGNDL